MGYECVIKFVPLSSIRRNTIVKIYLLHVEDLQLLQRAGFLVFCSIARIQSLHVFKALALLLKHLGEKSVYVDTTDLCCLLGHLPSCFSLPASFLYIV